MKQFILYTSKAVTSPDFSLDDLVIASIFSAGCLLGLLSFSKLLRWLLAHYRIQTMAVLCGFMLGSLRKLWPFRTEDAFPGTAVSDLLPAGLTGNLPACWVPDELVLPSGFNGRLFWSIVLAVAAFVAVFILDKIAHGGRETPSPQATAKEE